MIYFLISDYLYVAMTYFLFILQGCFVTYNCDLECALCEVYILVVLPCPFYSVEVGQA
jgi:hypothetical protein